MGHAVDLSIISNHLVLLIRIATCSYLVRKKVSDMIVITTGLDDMTCEITRSWQGCILKCSLLAAGWACLWECTSSQNHQRTSPVGNWSWKNTCPKTNRMDLRFWAMGILMVN